MSMDASAAPSSSISFLRGSTSLDINVENMWFAADASSTVSRFKTRVLGSSVVDQSCSGIIFTETFETLNVL